MKPNAILSNKTKRLFGWIGTTCLLLIILIKAVRWVNLTATTTTIIGIAPSVLGPAGLLLLVLSSSSSRLVRLTLVQTTFLVGAIAIGLEFIQLIPRPGILERVHYTFDWLDIAVTLLSVFVGFVVARFISHSK